MILNRRVGGGLSDKVTFEQKLRGAEGFIVWASGKRLLEQSLRRLVSPPAQGRARRPEWRSARCWGGGAEGKETASAHNENQVTQSSVGHWKDSGFHSACNGCPCGTAARHETEIQLTFCKDHFGCRAGQRQRVVGEQVGGRGAREGYGSDPSKNDVLKMINNQSISSGQMLERCHQSFI